MENEKFVYYGSSRWDKLCSGSIKRVLMNRYNTPIGVECTCGKYHIVIGYLEDDNKIINRVLCRTQFSEEDLNFLLEEKSTYDDSYVKQ